MSTSVSYMSSQVFRQTILIVTGQLIDKLFQSLAEKPVYLEVGAVFGKRNMAD